MEQFVRICESELTDIRKGERWSGFGWGVVLTIIVFVILWNWDDPGWSQCD